MAISFQQAPIIGSDVPTSAQFNQLADAYRERMLNVGDIAWRIVQDAYCFSRLFRNPNETGIAFERLDNWLSLYCHLPPDIGESLGIPSTGPGGLNRNSNPIALFAMGTNPEVDPGILPEFARTFTEGKVFLPFTPLTDAEKWTYGHAQRGAITGALYATGTQSNAPALDASQYHYRILANRTAKTGIAWGGFLASPRQVDTIQIDGFDYPILEFPFRYVGDDPGTPDRVYYGGGAGTAKATEWAPHILGIAITGLFYRIVLVDGSIVDLDANDWLLSPTGNGIASHTESNLHNIILHKFAGEFRGDDFERVTTGYRVQDYGLDFQAFYDSQYLLAPARGVLSGSDVVRDTVSFAITDPTSGDALTCNKGGEAFQIPAGFVLAGVYASGSGLSGLTSVEILVGSQVVTTIAVDGSGSKYRTITPAIPAASVRMRAASTATGTITIEILELLDYRPQVWDAYLVTRGGGADIRPGEHERTGHEVETPKVIFDGLRANGVLTSRYNSAGLDELEEISENAIYQTTREFLRDHVRLCRREIIRGYYTDAQGRSVIVCNRAALTSDYEVFDGLADAVGGAPVSGFSNEWCLYFSWIPDDTSSSEFQRAIYGDVMGLNNNPAFLFSEELRNEGLEDLRAQVTFGAGVAGSFAYVDENGDPQNVSTSDHVRNVFLAEAPPGASYSKGTNSPSSGGMSEQQTIDFFTANQIYSAPYQVASIVSDGDQVQITLTGRLRNSGLVASVNDQPSGWEFSQERYRTDENALMRYLARFVGGQSVAMPLLIGDYSPSAHGFLTSGRYPNSGCILPRMALVRLPSLAYEDGNDTQNPGVDTRVMSDQYRTLAWYSQHVAETFVSPSGTLGQCSEGIQMVNYTLGEAIRVANGKRLFEVTDGTLGFGAMPNIRIKADLFNQYSRFVNLMTRLRIDLPILLEMRIISTSGRALVTPTASGGGWAVNNSSSAPTTGLTYADSGWIDWGDGQAAGIAYILRPDGASWYVIASEIRVQFRLKPNALELFAIPATIRDMALANAGLWMDGTLGFEYYPSVTAPGSESYARVLDAGGGEAEVLHDWAGAAPYDTMEVTVSSGRADFCQFLAGGLIVAPTPPAGVLYYSDGVSNIIESRLSFSPLGVVGGASSSFIDVPLRA